MDIIIKINCDNDALVGNEYSNFNMEEVREILAGIAVFLEDASTIGEYKLYDSNGNVCGSFTLSK